MTLTRLYRLWEWRDSNPLPMRVTAFTEPRLTNSSITPRLRVGADTGSLAQFLTTHPREPSVAEKEGLEPPRVFRPTAIFGIAALPIRLFLQLWNQRDSNAHVLRFRQVP